jgi:hypothetical protein
MSQPKHLRAPATPASVSDAHHSSVSVLLEDWTSLSSFAVPLMAPAAITREPARPRGDLLAWLPWVRRLGAV